MNIHEYIYIHEFYCLYVSHYFVINLNTGLNTFLSTMFMDVTELYECTIENIARSRHSNNKWTRSVRFTSDNFSQLQCLTFIFVYLHLGLLQLNYLQIIVYLQLMASRSFLLSLLVTCRWYSARWRYWNVRSVPARVISNGRRTDSHWVWLLSDSILLIIIVRISFHFEPN